MTRKTLYMETTEIAAEKSAAEISGALVAGGAASISTRYEAGKIIGLTWSIKLGGNDLHFSMPARVEPVYALLCKRRGSSLGNETKTRLRAQAERVAWRQLLRWVQAQLAMIETGMVQHAEVFLPYVTQHDGRTMFEYFESRQKRLPASQTTQ